MPPQSHTSPPLDEIQWQSPPDAQSMSGIHTNSILHYFALSPFFDPTSNNASLVSQFQHNPRTQHIIATREAMEARLRTMSGLEFVVAREPVEMDPGTGTGVWVIRKQTRRKRGVGVAAAKGEEDEITVHATYFVVGENVYMAPTLGDILGNRALSMFASLNAFSDAVAALPTSTPALGNTYTTTTTSTKTSQTAGLSQRSKESTPAPTPDALNLSRGKTQARGTSATASASASDITAYAADALLASSLRATFQYADEYMDENPITGQPGDFHLSSTGRKSKTMMPTKLVMPAFNARKGPLQGVEKDKEGEVSPVGSVGSKTPVGGEGIGTKERKGPRVGKSPRTAGMKLGRRKSSKGSLGKGAATPTS